MAGSIFTKESVASQLEEANRNYYGQKTWANLFGGADLSRQLALENLKTGYGSAIGQSYASIKSNESNLIGSNLGQGYKEALLESNEAALEEAYNSYLQNYRDEADAIGSVFAQQHQNINDSLMSQADYTARYGNAHYSYLQELFKRYEEGTLTNDLFSDPNYAKYVNVDANGYQTLKSVGEIEGMIFDENKNLNRAGIDFFDQLEHDDLLMDYSFSDYLRENDEELYNWSIDNNPYNFAPNALGLNINDATFREMVGQSSIDEQYSFLERAYGMNDGQITSLFTSSQNLVKDIEETFNDTSLSDKKKEEKLRSTGDELSKELTATITDLGLTSEVNAYLNELGYSNLEEFINGEIENYLANLNADVEVTDAAEHYDKLYNEVAKKYDRQMESSIDNIKRQDWRNPIGAALGTGGELLNAGVAVVGWFVESIWSAVKGFHMEELERMEKVDEKNETVRQSGYNVTKTYNNLISTLINRSMALSK